MRTTRIEVLLQNSRKMNEKNLDIYNKILQQGGYKILPRTALKVSDNAVKFLDGLTTNEMAGDRNAFLDRLGRLVALVEQKIVNDEAHIILENSHKDRLLQHLDSYLKISRVKIGQLNMKVVSIIEGKNGGFSHILKEFQKNDNIMIKNNMGYTVLLDNMDILDGIAEIPDEIYEIIRIENNIPLQGIDFDSCMFLETGLYDAVSFTKGCYLGQEIIARTHNLGKPARMLVRILYEKLPEDGNVRISGEIAGKITSGCFSPKYNKFLAFAMIRDYDKEVDGGIIVG
ncbi:hypothetical protein HYT54_04520 [Candidatus Woesearchaeota archaeon]|nr:hypothetical protein [Candidatus Woesearchaeota archaeon]